MAGFGAKVKLEGESEFRSALKDINTNLKLVTSELKVTSEAFNHGDKSVKEAKSSYNSMNTTVDEQKKKIATLKDTVAEMTKKYGEDNEQVKIFKTQLNNAEAQLIKMDDATSKNTKELKEMEKSMDDAGTSGLKLGDIIKANLISEAVISGVKALGSAFKGLMNATVDLSKQSISAYADYQQLVGGVETLFGTGGLTIEEYAKKVGKSVAEVEEAYINLDTAQSDVLYDATQAYKTAGLSANQYMETVTSFSASLIQSLKGNTVEAGYVANRAIIDMADNANKMGTDMSLIQSAYNGFAKQNYTMLDNLKLG